MPGPDQVVRTRQASSCSIHERQAVLHTADHVIPANPDRIILTVTPIGTGGRCLVAEAETTTNGTDGIPLDPGSAAGEAGDTYRTTDYTGPVALRAVSAGVSVQIVEKAVRR